VYFDVRAPRRTLLAELVQAISIPPHKSSSATQVHVLLDSTKGGGRVLLQTTNFDESFLCAFTANIEAAGRIALPTQNLLDYIRLLPGGDISITADEPNTIIVRSGKSKTRFTGADTTAFPLVKVAPKPFCHMGAEVLLAALRRTQFAISPVDNRHLISCLLLSLGATRTRLVSTDGSRLSLVEMPGDSPKALEILIPRPAIEPLVALVGAAGNNNISIAVDETSTYFRTTSRVLSVHRVDGTYPNYEAILPTGQSNTVSVGRQLLLAGVDHMMQFADSRKSIVKVQVRENILELSAASPECGDAKERIEVAFKGQAFAASYNPTYMCDFLKSVESSQRIYLSFLDSRAALELLPAEDNHSFTFRHLLMPCGL
jgi:DNA polymerase-3 subunit beta